MKTKLLISIVILALTVSVSVGQKLNFNSKTQLLIPEKGYLLNADWEKLFYDGDQTNVVKRIGWNMQVTFAEDGSVLSRMVINIQLQNLTKPGRP